MKKHFKPRARLLLQLGDKLIKSENIAVLELVKNAYDADAKECTVVLKDIDSLEDWEIVIRDTWVGMTRGLIENVWLEPGADFKDLILQGKREQLSLEFDFDRTKRAPIGEKGVGRFGAHKLWGVIEMITKSGLSDREIVVKVDWSQFEKEKYLEDVNFEVTERVPELFTGNGSWTQLKITKLKKVWSKEMFRELTRALSGLNSPFFEKNDAFRVDVKLEIEDKDEEDEWMKESLDISDVLNSALWKLDAEIEGTKITKFDFQFTPFATMDRLKVRSKTIFSMKEAVDGWILLEKNVDLGKFKIWKVRVVAYVFDLGGKIIKLWNHAPKSIKEYLEQNWWVRVYRDWLRIYDYGEQWNDWLELDRKRINTPSKVIWNKNILASVELDRKSSQDLIEKTNREGFTENDGYYEFKKAIEQVLELLTQERNIDKENIREFYEWAIKNEPVNAEIDALEDLVSERFDEETLEGEGKTELRNRIFESLSRIKKQYQETNEILLKSAGAGLSLWVIVHELEKRIRALYSGLKDNSISDLSLIRDSIDWILNMIDGYSKIITSNNKKEIGIPSLLNRALLSNEFRFRAHKIEVQRNYLELGSDLRVNCVENIMLGVILNIFDNSIYWLEKYGITEKKIYITAKDYWDWSVWVIIADNWKWFSIDPEIAIKPFITKKIGWMGLWLYIVDEMMKSINGSLLVRNFSECADLPIEYADGAIIELLFPKV